MRKLALWIAMCVPAVGAAAERCPWLNAATAGGVLGGDITSVALKIDKHGDGSCDFVRRDGPVSRHLFIEVQTKHPARDYASFAAQCGAQAAPLKAMGSEAAACSYEGKGGEAGEQVVGRVRNEAFAVRMSAGDRAESAGELRVKVRQIAEQVAGALF